MAVDAVDDEAHADPLVGEGGPGRPRGAVMEGRHGAEEVGDESGARGDARAELVVGGVRVAEAHHDARARAGAWCARAAPGRSGARVTMRTSGLASQVSSRLSGADSIAEARCAPLRSAERNGTFDVQTQGGGDRRPGAPSAASEGGEGSRVERGARS